MFKKFILLTLIVLTFKNSNAQKVRAEYFLRYNYGNTKFDSSHNIEIDTISIKEKLIDIYATNNIKFKITVETINPLSNKISLENASDNGIEIQITSNNTPPFLKDGQWIIYDKNKENIRKAELEEETFFITKRKEAILGYECEVGINTSKKGNKIIWFVKNLPQSINPGINCIGLPYAVFKYADFENGVFYEIEKLTILSNN